MTTFKKTLSALLAAVMLICAMSVASVAFAEDENETEDEVIIYDEDKVFKFAVIGEEGSESVRLDKLNPKKSEAITLPAEVKHTGDDGVEKTYVVTEVAEDVFAPVNEQDALEADILYVSVGDVNDANYDTFINAYKDAFKNVDTVQYLYIPYVLKSFASAVKADAAAALSDAGITSPEALTDYVAAAYYKYTTAMCDALGLTTVIGYMPLSNISDEIVTYSNGVLYTSSLSSVYTRAAAALEVMSIPSTLLTIPETKSTYEVIAGTERISGYAFVNRTVEALGLPESIKSFGKGTYVAEGETEAALHNTFDTATVKYLENRSKEFSAIIASGIVKAGIEVASVEDFEFQEYVTDHGGKFSELSKTRLEEATSVLQKLSAFFKRIVEFFQQLLARLKG